MSRGFFPNLYVKERTSPGNRGLCDGLFGYRLWLVFCSGAVFLADSLRATQPPMFTESTLDFICSRHIKGLVPKRNEFDLFINGKILIFVFDFLPY